MISVSVFMVQQCHAQRKQRSYLQLEKMKTDYGLQVFYQFLLVQNDLLYTKWKKSLGILSNSRSSIKQATVLMCMSIKSLAQGHVKTHKSAFGTISIKYS